MPLSQEYISDRSLRIHTDESFAKAIQEAALEAAAEALQSPTKDVINIATSQSRFRRLNSQPWRV
jgi:hypothetical protein